MQALSAAGSQTWPAFALVAGLLLIGAIGDREGLFAWLGTQVAVRLPGGAGSLFAALLGLVALVTVVLNLDTAVVFLTPLLIGAARARSLRLAPFVYGTVFMCNAASLLLPGSNLTNLLVLERSAISGSTFAALMALPWLAAILVTGGGVWLLHRRALQPRFSARVAPESLRGRTAAAAAAAAAAVMLVLRDPALPVLGMGTLLALWHVARRNVTAAEAVRAVNAPLLAALFVLSVGLGAGARALHVVAIAGNYPASAGVLAGAIGAVLINNLPAAVVLSSHPPAHPLFLLLGLDIGPNLAVSGALSALLWMRVARAHGVAVSMRRYTVMGAPLAAVAMAGAALCLALVSTLTRAAV